MEDTRREAGGAVSPSPSGGSGGSGAADGVHHWTMHQIPPFFTLQPVPATLQRQLSMWAAVVLDHAAYHCAHAKPPVESSMMRLYEPTSSLFTSARLRRTLPPDAARQVLEYMAEQFPNHCSMMVRSTGSDTATESCALLVSCVRGGMEAQSAALFRWVLEESNSATTATDLAKNGTVLTFDELVEGRCLYGQDAASPLLDMDRVQRVSQLMPQELKNKNSGAISDETMLRSFMQALSERAGSAQAASLKTFRVRMFNLDGSPEPPYDGVKIGG